MPDHVVSQGECLSSIAESYGLLRHTVWEHSRNAALREKRRNGDTLFPGDVLYIPEITEKQFTRAVDRRHAFVRKSERVRFRLRLLLDEQPRAAEPYTMNVGAFTYSGETDASGWLDVTIPAAATEGTLLLTDSGEQHILRFGTIDPIEEVSGVQGRLRNLGYLEGEVTGLRDEETVRAIRAFQQKHELPPTGEVDDPTKDLLKKEYGH